MTRRVARARTSVRVCGARPRSTCVRPLTLRRGQQCQITGYVASAKLIARRPEFPPGLHPFVPFLSSLPSAGEPVTSPSFSSTAPARRGYRVYANDVCAARYVRRRR